MHTGSLVHHKNLLGRGFLLVEREMCPAWRVSGLGDWAVGYFCWWGRGNVLDILFLMCGLYWLLLLVGLYLLLLSWVPCPWEHQEALAGRAIEDITVAFSAENNKDKPQLMKLLVLTALQTTDANSHLQPQETCETQYYVDITATSFTPRCDKHPCNERILSWET